MTATGLLKRFKTRLERAFKRDPSFPAGTPLNRLQPNPAMLAALASPMEGVTADAWPCSMYLGGAHPRAAFEREECRRIIGRF